MRILFWSELFWPHVGGVEVLGAELVRALCRRGFEITVVTSHDDSLGLADRDDHYGAEVLRFPFRSTLVARDMVALLDLRQRLAELKSRLHPALVHVFGLGPSALFHLQTRGALPAPELITLHGEVLRGGADQGDTVLEKTLAGAGWVACVSQAVLHAARAMAPQIEARSSVVYNAIPPSPSEPARPDRVRPTVLCVGRFVHDKGFDVAVAAFRAVAERCPAARLIVAGDGPLRGALEAQAGANGLEGCVEFPGWVRVSDVSALLATADVVVMPSRREGLPLLALQAAQMGVPVVATAVGGLPEAVDEGSTGLLVAPDDPAALGDAIVLLLQSREVAERMGQAARALVATRFDWDRYVDAHVTLYHRLCHQP